MHEFGLLDSLLDDLRHRYAAQVSGPVRRLRLRRGWGVAEEALRQAFTMQSPGTLFEGADLEVLEPVVTFRCVCGQAPSPEALEADHHAWICPACQRAQAVPASHELEVLDVCLR